MIELQIGNGLVRISAGMVGILLNSCSPRELQRLTVESGLVLRTDHETSKRCGVAESDLSTEDTVLSRVRGAMSYEVRTGMDFNLHLNRK